MIAPFETECGWKIPAGRMASLICDFDDEAEQTVNTAAPGSAEPCASGVAGGRAPAAIAIVERNRRRANQLSRVLASAGYRCLAVRGIAELDAHASAFDVEMVVLGASADCMHDLILLWFLRESRRWHDRPVLMPGCTGDEQMALLIERGADMCMRWPASGALLVAHVRALMRRARLCRGMLASETYGPYTFQVALEGVTIDGESVMLTHREFNAALLLFRSCPRAVSYDTIWDRVWGAFARREPERRTIGVCLSRVRNKLRLTGKYGYRLVAQRAQGYRLVPVRGDGVAVWPCRAPTGPRHAGGPEIPPETEACVRCGEGRVRPRRTGFAFTPAVSAHA
ncbi:response regulator transcription factor [Burkholderia ubonensis]|uniref:response regulator transcription factor n=1 Tax=Burkholderia ubonensis TaxID=101571 RepID=UPI00358E21B3